MASASPSPTPARKPSRRRLWLALGVLGVFLATLGCAAFFLATGGPEESEETESEEPPSGPPDSPEAARDRKLARAVLGTWHDTYMGTERTTTLREDGTGEMVVQTIGSATLSFEMVWSIADGKLRLRSLRGEPKLATELILRVQGRSAEHPILEAESDRLVLLDRDGKTRLEWRRAP